ncbi:hypothetical protein EDB92DRAFT_329806 [Lactarius akahatsu]|uniref:Transmembrane protein n=1 Tax=Lactarius akahatsu TaxID=416441 RepID=A0AAD4L7B6_9AGAM|nr:hypothetical protein EDB92DRAFT_329806 [Lactarius akahatsu]
MDSPFSTSTFFFSFFFYVTLLDFCRQGSDYFSFIAFGLVYVLLAIHFSYLPSYSTRVLFGSRTMQYAIHMYQPLPLFRSRIPIRRFLSPAKVSGRRSQIFAFLFDTPENETSQKKDELLVFY